MAPERDFESSFGQLASVELGQRVPTLMPFLIGFQLVRKTSNDAHAMGVFCFVVGKQTYYVPVFWMNGQLKGMNTILIKKQKTSVPLTEKWVNHVASKTPFVTGSGTNMDPGMAGAGRPNLDFYRRFGMSKASADADYCKDMLEAFEAPGKSFDLFDALDHCPSMAKRAYDLFEQNPELAEAAFTLHPAAESFARLCKAAGVGPEKSAAYKMTPTKLTPVVKYLTDASGQQYLEESQREAMMRGEPFVENEGSATIVNSSDFQLTQPVDQAAATRVLTETGDLLPVLIFKDFINLDGKRQNWAMVVDLAAEAVTMAQSKDIHTTKSQPNSWSDVYSVLPSVSEIPEGSLFSLVTPAGTCLIPLVAEKAVTGDEIFARYETVRPQLSDDSPGFDNGSATTIPMGDSNLWGVRILLVDGGESFTRVGDTLYVRRDKVKVLPIATMKDDGPHHGCYQDIKRVRLGGNAALDRFVYADNVKKASVSAGEAYTPACYRRLVEGCRLPMATAKAAMARAVEDGSYEFFVKDAAVSFPSMNSTYSSEFGVPAMEPIHREELVEYRDKATTVYDRSLDPKLVNRGVQQEAMRAFNAGTTEVFDMSVFNSILNSDDVGDDVKESVPVMMKGMNELANTLNKLYWRYADFAERYGPDSLKELEDLLVGSLRQTGDTILFLKKSTLEPDDIADEAVV